MGPTRFVLSAALVLGVSLAGPVRAADPAQPAATASAASGPWAVPPETPHEGLEEGGRRVVAMARADLEPHALVEEALAVLPQRPRQEAAELLDLREGDGVADVGVFAGGWSEDRPDYPRWPDDPARPVRVLDSTGAAFANLAEDGSWRRESSARRRATRSSSR